MVTKSQDKLNGVAYLPKEVDSSIKRKYYKLYNPSTDDVMVIASRELDLEFYAATGYTILLQKSDKPYKNHISMSRVASKRDSIYGASNLGIGSSSNYGYNKSINGEVMKERHG